MGASERSSANAFREVQEEHVEENGKDLVFSCRILSKTMVLRFGIQASLIIKPKSIVSQEAQGSVDFGLTRT